MNKVILGIENIDNYKELFKNKRVGLITNPTGITSDFESSIDVLRKKSNLVGLFSPEHGVRASIQAGVHLDTYIDEDTGITVYSLYGKNKKPSKEVLDNVDILSIDIQDNGSRYYTFIYRTVIREDNMDKEKTTVKDYMTKNVVTVKYNALNDLNPRIFLFNLIASSKYCLMYSGLSVSSV